MVLKAVLKRLDSSTVWSFTFFFSFRALYHGFF